MYLPGTPVKIQEFYSVNFGIFHVFFITFKGISSMPTDTTNLTNPTPSQEEAVSRAMAVASGTPANQLAVPITSEDYQTIALAMGDNTAVNEIQYARLSIMQSKSPELDSETPLPGYAVGQIFNNITRQVYSVNDTPPWLPKEVGSGLKFNFSLIVPIFKLPTEFIKWKDRNTEGPGMHWKSLDQNDSEVRKGSWPPIGTWKKPSDPAARQSPPVTQNMNFLCCVLHPVTLEVLDPMVVLTFAKTNFKAGKILFTSCQMHRTLQLPFWGITYYLFTSFKKFTKGTAYIYNIAKGPLLKKIKPEIEFEQQLFSIAKSLSDPTRVDNKTQGRINQELVINSAVLMEDAGDDLEGEGEDELAGAGHESTENPF